MRLLLLWPLLNTVIDTNVFTFTCDLLGNRMTCTFLPQDFIMFKFKNDVFFLQKSEIIKLSTVSITEDNELILTPLDYRPDYEFYLLDYNSCTITPIFIELNGNIYLNIDIDIVLSKISIGIKLNDLYYYDGTTVVTSEEMFKNKKVHRLCHISYDDRVFYMRCDDMIYTKNYFDSDIVEPVPEFALQYGSAFYIKNVYTEITSLKFVD